MSRQRRAVTQGAHSLGVSIGGVPIAFQLDDGGLAQMIAARYAGFLCDPARAIFSFLIETVPRADALGNVDAEVEVRRCGDLWRMSRGDFRAEWSLATAQGRIRQTANPYSVDCVLRIVHSLLLAPQGGFLLHASSAIRNGRAFMFAGASGAGKTTLARLAPPEATLLTDEISYLRRANAGSGYRAFGTPFAGDLMKAGENIEAPLATLYVIAHGDDNRIEDISAADAMRALLANVLFFTQSAELVAAVFESALEFVHKTPVKRLTFQPDARVWEIIQ